MIKTFYDRWTNGKKDDVTQTKGKVMKTQVERCLQYLQINRRINPLESWQVLGIYRLSAVILKLRKRGYVISTIKTPVKNQFGESCEVATYVLEND